MDDIVAQAMAKWPNVPNCYGWLGLDMRGDWYMRDDQTQAIGDFKTACLHGDKAAKGSRLTHEKLLGFIARNYACDAQGQWYFQNGPQRVYVELEATPYIWRLFVQGSDNEIEVRSHTGVLVKIQKCFSDETGKLYLLTDLGLGLIHSMDMGIAADALECGVWTLTTSLQVQ